VWREVEVVGVGNVVSLFSARAFVWGDVDPHGGGLGAGEPDGSAVVVEIRATSPLGYASILGETGEPTLGWKEGSGAAPLPSWLGQRRGSAAAAEHRGPLGSAGGKGGQMSLMLMDRDSCIFGAGMRRRACVFITAGPAGAILTEISRMRPPRGLTADSLCVAVLLGCRHVRCSRCGWWTGAK
jgi:hypothetical protein